MQNNTKNGEVLIGEGFTLPREEALRGLLVIGPDVPGIWHRVFFPNIAATYESYASTSLVALYAMSEEERTLDVSYAGVEQAEDYDFGTLRRRGDSIVMAPEDEVSNAQAIAKAIDDLVRVGSEGDVPVNLFIDTHYTGAIRDLPMNQTLFRGWDICLSMATHSPRRMEELYGEGDGEVLLANFANVLVCGGLSDRTIGEVQHLLYRKGRELPALRELRRYEAVFSGRHETRTVELLPER